MVMMLLSAFHSGAALVVRPELSAPQPSKHNFYSKFNNFLLDH